MKLNGRQMVKIAIAVVFTLYVLYGAPGVNLANKAIIVAIMWLATAAAVWLRRDRN